MLARLALSAALALTAGAAAAETHQVKMLNKGADGLMVFEPAFVAAQPGDVIEFLPTDKGHNAESIKGMIPEGAEAFRGKMNQPVSLTVEKEGLYGVKCMPHFAMGMIALIQVGEPTNLDAAKAANMPGKAKQRFAPLFEQVQ